MRFRKSLVRSALMPLVALSLAAPAGAVFGAALAPQPAGTVIAKPAGQAATAQSIADAQAQVDFHVRTAGWLPFGIPVEAFTFPSPEAQASAGQSQPTAFAMVMPSPGGGPTVVEVTYVAGQQNYVTITTLNRPTPREALERMSPTTTTLADGRTAVFLDNGIAQILSWSDDAMSYQIAAQRPSGPYTAAELAEIANALQ